MATTPESMTDAQINELVEKHGDSMSPEGRRLFDFGRALMRAQEQEALGIDLTKFPNLKPSYTKTPVGFMAVDDNSYDGPGSPVGWGSTKLEALADLVEKLEG